MTQSHTKIKDHSDFAASSAYRWLECPGSVKACKDAPPQAESSFAKEGTDAHALAEKYLTLMYSGQGVGAKAKADKILNGLSKQDREFMKIFIDTVRSRYKIGDKLLIEKKFFMKIISDEIFGTVDVGIWSPKKQKLTIIDLKWGKGIVVEANENPQLAHYAVSAASDMQVVPKEIECIIVQPRAYHEDGPVRSWKFDESTFDLWYKKFKEGYKIAKSPNAKLSAGDHCRFCNAAPTCPEVRTKALAVARQDFAGIIQEPKIDLIDPKELDAVSLGKILDGAKLLEDWLSSIRSHAYLQLQKGVKIPGWKFVEKRAFRKWTEQGIRKLEQEYGPLAFEQKVLSPAQFEEKRKGDAQAKALIEKYTVKESSGFTIAPDKDKRVATSRAKKDFEAIPSWETETDDLI